MCDRQGSAEDCPDKRLENTVDWGRAVVNNVGIENSKITVVNNIAYLGDITHVPEHRQFAAEQHDQEISQ